LFQSLHQRRGVIEARTASVRVQVVEFGDVGCAPSEFLWKPTPLERVIRSCLFRRCVMRFLVLVTSYKGKKGKSTDCNGRNNPPRPHHDTTLHIPNRRVQCSKASLERIVWMLSRRGARGVTRS